VNKQLVLGAGSAVVASVCMTLFGTGIAAADDYAGMTYGEAQEQAGSGTTLVVAGRVGGKLDQDDCIVTWSQTAPFLRDAGDEFTHAVDEVMVSLNCNGGHATVTNPGASVASPTGRESKAAADEAAAAERRQLEAVSTPDE
jgi:hypothetical protein